MSALATEWAPGYSTPGARPFENMPSDLELAGVQFAPEQLDLMERAARFRPGWYQRMHIMTVFNLPDPVFPHSEALGLPALSLDDSEGRLLLDPILVPVVAEVDCSEWETMDENEPNWRRFPSILARRHVYSPYTGTIVEGLTAVRLWDCWEIDENDVEMVKEAMAQWMKNEWEPYRNWLEVRDNADSTGCDYEGTPAHLHDHQFDEHGYQLPCPNGERWFEHYLNTEITTDPDGDPYHRPFGPVAGLHHLRPVWESLLATSRANTLAAMAAYPEWEQEAVARTERHYSPWLWSS